MGINGVVKFVDFYVIDCNIPILLGYEFLNDRSIKSFQFHKNKLTLNRKINNKYFKTIFKFADNHEPNTYSANKTEFLNKKDNSITENKIQLVEKLGITINKKSEPEHLDKVCDLIMDYKDIFGSECEKLGKFPSEVPILTVPGKSIYVKQHAIAAAYKLAVISEIKNMLQMGVIEKCDNTNGWNSPIFAVPKNTVKCA